MDTTKYDTIEEQTGSAKHTQPPPLVPANPVSRQTLEGGDRSKMIGVLIERSDISIILLGIFVLSILLNWLNPWVCQIGGVLLMFALGILVIIRKSWLLGILILSVSISVGAIAYQEAQSFGFLLKSKQIKYLK